MDILSRFDFKQMPFTREIRPQEFLSFPHLDEEIEALAAVVHNRMSAALIAPAGTGKTFVLRALRERLPEARFAVHYVKVTGLSKRDMCREICTAIGARSAGTYPGLVRSIQERMLGSLDGDGRRPVLLIDEAHDMRTSVLAMLRLLTNFDMDSRLVVSIILAGQPTLAARLRHEELEAIARRLAHRAELRLLSREESFRYITHRVHVAGASRLPFDKVAMDALFELGRGNMRALDELARKALEIADRQECAVVDSTHVIAAKERLWV